MSVSQTPFQCVHFITIPICLILTFFCVSTSIFCVLFSHYFFFTFYTHFLLLVFSIIPHFFCVCFEAFYANKTHTHGNHVSSRNKRQQKNIIESMQTICMCNTREHIIRFKWQQLYWLYHLALQFQYVSNTVSFIRT